MGSTPKTAPELVQMFLAGHGYGVSAEEARNAVSRVGMMGSTLEAFGTNSGKHRIGDVTGLWDPSR